MGDGTAPLDAFNWSQILRAENPFVHRDVFAHWTSERIRWSDTDQLGHVNNLAISAYFETGRTELLRDLFTQEAPRRALLLLARISIDYLGELHWPGQVEVGSGIVEFGRSSCRFAQGAFSGERCIACAESVLVHIDAQSRRPRELPAWLREQLAVYRLAVPPPSG